MWCRDKICYDFYLFLQSFSPDKFVFCLYTNLFLQQRGEQSGSSLVASPSVSQLFFQNPCSEAHKLCCLLDTGEDIEAFSIMLLFLCACNLFAIIMTELILSRGRNTSVHQKG